MGNRAHACPILCGLQRSSGTEREGQIHGEERPADAASWRGPEGSRRRLTSDPIRTHTTSHAHTARSRVRPILSVTHFSSSLPRQSPRDGHFAHASSELPRRDLGFCLIECCSDYMQASLPYAPASCTHSHTLSSESYCSPPAGKSSSPAGLSTIVHAYIVDCAPASPYTYSTSEHRFPDERTHTPPRLRLFQRHLRCLVRVCVWVWDGFRLARVSLVVHRYPAANATKTTTTNKQQQQIYVDNEGH